MIRMKTVEKVTLRNRLSIVSLILGTLTLTSLSTQKAEAAWNAATCKVKCNKTVLANRSSKDFSKNVNDCAANCDNTKIKDSLIAFCKNLNPTNKGSFQKTLQDEKMGYENANLENQENIKRFEKATDSRGKKYLKDYQNKSKALMDKANAVEKQMQNCEMTLTSTPNTSPTGIDSSQLSLKEKELFGALASKSSEATLDVKKADNTGNNEGFVSATPGKQSGSSGNVALRPTLGQHRAPTNSATSAAKAPETSSQTMEQSSEAGNTNTVPVAPPPPPPPPINPTRAPSPSPAAPGSPRGNLLAEIQRKKTLNPVDTSKPHPSSNLTPDSKVELQSALSSAITQRRGAMVGKSESNKQTKTDDDDWK